MVGSASVAAEVEGSPVAADNAEDSLADSRAAGSLASDHLN